MWSITVGVDIVYEVRSAKLAWREQARASATGCVGRHAPARRARLHVGGFGAHVQVDADTDVSTIQS